MNICLYGASSTELDARYLDAAYDLGRRIAAGGHTMVYGGGAQGVMGAAARGVVDGGDAVGMSTVTEALTAAHCGLPILGLSVITNMAAGVTGAALSGAEVNETGAAIGAKFSAYLKSILKEL